MIDNQPEKEPSGLALEVARLQVQVDESFAVMGSIQNILGVVRPTNRREAYMWEQIDGYFRKYWKDFEHD